MPNITYYELNNYNNSMLVPATFELSGKTYDDHLTELTEWLDSLPLIDGYKCEEYIVCDYEDIPAEYVGEWSISEEFFDYLSLVESSFVDELAIKAGVSLGIPLDKIEDAYYGCYESNEALAEEFIDSGCMGDIPDHLINYIDTERLGRDLSYDFLEHDGYYFYANY